MRTDKTPLFTKPAGVFVQLLGASALLWIPSMNAWSTGSVVVGIIVCFGLLALGRQVR
jgi:hypothetical protein